MCGARPSSSTCRGLGTASTMKTMTTPWRFIGCSLAPIAGGASPARHAAFGSDGGCFVGPSEKSAPKHMTCSLGSAIVMERSPDQASPRDGSAALRRGEIACNSRQFTVAAQAGCAAAPFTAFCEFEIQIAQSPRKQAARHQRRPPIADAARDRRPSRRRFSVPPLLHGLVMPGGSFRHSRRPRSERQAPRSGDRLAPVHALPDNNVSYLWYLMKGDSTATRSYNLRAVSLKCCVSQ